MKPDFIASLLGPLSSTLSVGSVFLRIILSLILSAIIGTERASKRHSAGLRTFIIITLASTSAALIVDHLMENGQAASWVLAAVIIASALISGYSVLFSSSGTIKGLTTSTGLWSCSVIGIAVGMGLYTIALLSFVALLLSLSLFPAIEKSLRDRSNHFEVHLELKNKSDLSNFIATIRKLGMRIDDIEMNPAYANSGVSAYTVLFTISSQELKKYKKHSEIIEALSSIDYVAYIEETA